jgi:cysteine sulfinate desulfinase/cysteine desulfurase-like protein
MSDTSTKRAEEVAYNLQLSGISGSTWSATEVEASNMLRALAAENEKLRAALRGVLTYYNAPTPAEAKLKKAVLATPIEQARAALGEKE